MTFRTLFFTIMSVLIVSSCNNEERQRPLIDFGISNPSVSGSRFPSLYSEDGDTVYMSWLSRIEEEMYALEFAAFIGGRWQAPQTVNVGVNFFVNWADFPSIVSYNQDPVAVHWLKKMEGGPYAYDIQVSFPGDESRRWNAITPHSDGTATEHGFVSMIPLDSESVLAIWLDGRHTEQRADEEYADMDQAMTLRSAIIHKDGTIENERIIDDTVCDCCQTDLVAVDGGAVAVYRNRTEGEVRDISIARYNFETGDWSEPNTVHQDGWEIAGCPVNGPGVTVSGDRITVIWYTEAEEDNRVLAARSDDGGETFSEPLLLNRGHAMGRVDIDAAPDGSVYASWMEQGDTVSRIFLRKIEEGDLAADPILIGSTDLGRGSGFPEVVALNEGILLAWTQTDPFHRVRTAFYRYETEEPIDQ